MMDIVTGCGRELPLDFRANPHVRGTARSKTMAMRRRRIHAEYAVITALISIASIVVGAAELPVTTWPRSEWAHAAAHGAALNGLIRPAPVGEVTPEPQIPAPTVNQVAPPVAGPPPRAERP